MSECGWVGVRRVRTQKKPERNVKNKINSGEKTKLKDKKQTTRVNNIMVQGF